MKDIITNDLKTERYVCHQKESMGIRIPNRWLMYIKYGEMTIYIGDQDNWDWVIFNGYDVDEINEEKARNLITNGWGISVQGLVPDWAKRRMNCYDKFDLKCEGKLVGGEAEEAENEMAASLNLYHCKVNDTIEEELDAAIPIFICEEFNGETKTKEEEEEKQEKET